MNTNDRHIRIAVNENDHRRIRLAAAINGQSIAGFTQNEVLRASEKATAGIDVPAMADTSNRGGGNDEASSRGSRLPGQATRLAN